MASLVWHSLVAVVFLPLSTISAAAQDHAVLWDGPAVTVFPDHEKIGPDRASIEAAISDGRELFTVKFNVLDGAGRPLATGDSKPTPRLQPVSVAFQRVSGLDAGACGSCHNEPSLGGSGDFVTNTFVGAHFSDPPTLSVATDVTNERNTITLFGSGVLERLAAEMSDDLRSTRRKALESAKSTKRPVKVSLVSKEVSFGSIVAHPDGYVDYKNLEGLDYDLVVKPFGIKGIVISLREFSINALNQHHGIQSDERFGWERTGLKDFDGDGYLNEFSAGQVTAMSLFQASLPPPSQKWSTDNAQLATERAGELIFSSTGCANCHRPELVLREPTFYEPNKYNRPGSLIPRYTSNVIKLDMRGFFVPDSGGRYVVKAFTDFKRHKMCDEEVRALCNEERKQDNVPVEFFATQELWDLATSAPYCHRGDCSTISEAILAHGGDGRVSRESFLKLRDDEKRSLIAYLRTLGRGEYLAAVTGGK